MKLGLRDIIDAREIGWAGCTVVVIFFFFNGCFSCIGSMFLAFFCEGDAGTAGSVLCSLYLVS